MTRCSAAARRGALPHRRLRGALYPSLGPRARGERYRRARHLMASAHLGLGVPVRATTAPRPSPSAKQWSVGPILIGPGQVSLGQAGAAEWLAQNGLQNGPRRYRAVRRGRRSPLVLLRWRVFGPVSAGPVDWLSAVSSGPSVRATRSRAGRPCSAAARLPERIGAARSGAAADVRRRLPGRHPLRQFDQRRG